MEERQAAGRGKAPARESTAGPGVQRAPTPAVSRMCGTCKPRHGPAPGAGRPIVRGAEYQAGKDGREANAGRRKAAGNQGSSPSSSRAGPWITGRIPDMGAGPERELTRAR